MVRGNSEIGQGVVPQLQIIARLPRKKEIRLLLFRNSAEILRQKMVARIDISRDMVSVGRVKAIKRPAVVLALIV